MRAAVIGAGAWGTALADMMAAAGHSVHIWALETDVVKAIALGADFVFIGRPFVYAASIGGQAGVAHAIRLLAHEIQQDMALIGVNSLRDLGPGALAQSPCRQRPQPLKADFLQ